MATASTTHWTQILALGHEHPQREQNLQDLCQTYWFPLYAYIRKLGQSAHDAEDITQAVFAKLICAESLQRCSIASAIRS